MTDRTVAKRYARALFAIGEEQGKSEVFAENVKEIKALIEENSEVAHMLENQSVETEAKKNAMKAILKQSDEVVKNFVCLVLDKGRAEYLANMCEVYQALVENSKNTMLAKVTSAVPLTESQISGIEERFSGLVGQKVKARTAVDSSLIGGVQVMIGDKLYDGTVAAQIKQMSNVLKQTEMLS